MSFTPNKLGLYDLGGNVWEWCEDWYNAKHVDRALRGAGWADYERGNLLSSRRIHLTPDARRFWVGFRCVVLSGS